MLTYEEQPLGVAWEKIHRLGNVDNDIRITKECKKQELSPMEALDLVKSKFATNFDKVEISKEEYYYKLDIADYYLVFEGMGENKQQYLIHLYEFIQDEPENGIGHTVTYGWYLVDMMTREIVEVQ